MRFFTPFTLLLLLLLMPITALAEIPTGMEADFAPVSGYIIMPIGDEFLVDLDASTNLQEGDILTLVMPGEKVVHPVTKEILGTLDIPKGYLQVSRIKSGYSYAKLLFSEVPPEKGDLIKRFEQVPTAYNTDLAETSLLNELKSGLPQLDWLKAGSTTQPLLTFELQNNLLSVKNSSGTTLKSYQFVDGSLVAPAPVTARNQEFAVDADPAKNKGFLNKSVNKLIDSVGLGTSKGPDFGPGIVRNKEALKNKGIWMSQNLAGEPAGLIVADLDNDGAQETVIAMRNQLQIVQIQQGELIEEATLDLPTGTTVLSIDSLDLDKNGMEEIYLTAARDQRLTSMVIEFDGTEYQTVISNIPWFLRVTELAGEGRALIAQRTGDQNKPFLGAPFRVTRTADQLEQGEELSLPANVNMFSFLPFAADSGSNIAYLTQSDYLKVISNSGMELWESGDYFGGTENSFYNTLDQDGDLIDPIYIQQRVLRGPAGEILVAQNDGLRTLKRFRMFKDSRVIALNWNGFALQESWRTSGQNGYLADFALADADNDGSDELVMVVKYKHKTVIQKARSAVVIYEIN